MFYVILFPLFFHVARLRLRISGDLIFSLEIIKSQSVFVSEVEGMFYVKPMDRTCFEMYDTISMNVDVRTEYKIKRIDNGLGGLMFEEVPVDTHGSRK